MSIADLISLTRNIPDRVNQINRAIVEAEGFDGIDRICQRADEKANDIFREDVKHFAQRIRQETGLSQEALAKSVGWKDRRNWDAFEKRGSIGAGQLCLVTARYREYVTFPPSRELDERCTIYAIELVREFDNDYRRHTLSYEHFLWLRHLGVDNPQFQIALDDRDVRKLEQIIVGGFAEIRRLLEDCVFLDLHDGKPPQAEPMLLEEVLELVLDWLPSFQVVHE